MRTKNFLILAVILLIGLVAVVVAEYFYEVNPDQMQACTEEAKVCPDGSAVGRTGPNCEFAECPIATTEEPVDESTLESFQFELEETVRIEIGQPIEGYEPFMFMQVFPNLLPEDFDGVEAMIGYYEYSEGKLNYEYEEGTLLHSAGPAITETGFKTLLNNVQDRLQLTTDTAVDDIILYLKDEVDSSPVACTMDAKMCPDGSFVGRTGPNCEFAECPSPEPEEKWTVRYGEDVSNMEEYRFDCEQRMGIFNECDSSCPDGVDACAAVCSMTCVGPAEEPTRPVPPDSTFCTGPSRDVDACIEIYQPVCGLTRVECITTPCDPIPETYSNSCFACMNERVISYSEGECEAQL